MTENWDPLKDTIANVEETRPVAPVEGIQGFVVETAVKILGKIPSVRLPIPPPPWILPDMTPAGLADVSGLVYDIETNNPIVGAIINIDSKSATSNADGLYSITGLQPKEYTLIINNLTEYKEVEMAIVLVEGSNVFDVALTPTYVPPGVASVTFTVVDSGTDLPISGVAVNLQTYGIVTTGANGVATFGNIVEGDYQITFSHANYETYTDIVSFHP